MARTPGKSGSDGARRKPIRIGKRKDLARQSSDKSGPVSVNKPSRNQSSQSGSTPKPKPKPKPTLKGTAKKPAKTSTRKSAPRRKTSTRRKPKMASNWFGPGSWLRKLAYGALVAGLWMGILVAGLLVWFARDLPDTSKIWDVDRQPSITFLDVRGEKIATRGASYAPPVKLADLPPALPAAVIAVEDKRFYHHPGIDLVGLARAMVVNVRAGHIVQGGSTLTQQLAKNLFLSNERTYKRKIQEVLLALWLEHKFSKDEILSLYLNRVYFGRGAWGVEAASQAYFGKPVRELNLGECAMIAGLLKAPNRYSPTSDLARAERRSTIVLDVMVETGKITPKQREMAFNTPITVKPVIATPSANYFVDWLVPQVRKAVGEVKTDLMVQTTLDLRAQRAAERAITLHMDPAATKAGATQAALIALGPNGAVRAMVGGTDYGKSQFNRATQSSRQPGSAFKPFVYLAALESGLHPWTVRTDHKIWVGDWSPSNYENEFEGDMDLQTALAKSVNTIAVQLAEEVGRGKVAALAHRLGMQSPIAITRSMSLGSNGVSLIDLVGAYVPFANGGYLAQGFGMTRVKARNGPVLWSRKDIPPPLVIADHDEVAMNHMLQAVVQEGTGRRARIANHRVAGKTGTTNDFRDAWFVGYTGDRIAGVWVGDDQNRPMRHVTGGKLPTDIWHDFILAWLAAEPVTENQGQAVAPEPGAEAAGKKDGKPDPDDPLTELLSSIAPKLE